MITLRLIELYFNLLINFDYYFYEHSLSPKECFFYFYLINVLSPNMNLAVSLFSIQALEIS